MRPRLCDPSLGALGKTEPQDVHGRTEILDFEPGQIAHRGVPAIGADDEARADLKQSFRSLGAETRY